MEGLANNASSTLNGSINNSVTSITVNDASTFPATGTFTILIETELIRVSSRATNVLTCVRGQEGTAAASHSTGLAVTVVLSKEALLSFRGDLYSEDDYASRPAVGAVGRHFYPIDSPMIGVEDGINWRSYYMPRLLKPDWTGYGFVSNYSDNPVTKTDKGDYSLFNIFNSANNTVPKYLKAMPVANDYIITVCFDFLIGAEDFPNMGLCVQNNSSGAFIVFGITNSSTLKLSIDYYSNFNTYSSTPKVYAMSRLPHPIQWFQIEDNGTNRIYRYSKNGIDWFNFYTETRTTNVTPDYYGMVLHSGHITVAAYGMVYSLEESS